MQLTTYPWQFHCCSQHFPCQFRIDRYLVTSYGNYCYYLSCYCLGLLIISSFIVIILRQLTIMRDYFFMFKVKLCVDSRHQFKKFVQLGGNLLTKAEIIGFCFFISIFQDLKIIFLGSVREFFVKNSVILILNQHSIEQVMCSQPPMNHQQ